MFIISHRSTPSNRYKDAVATIRRTTTDKNYQLVITRAYEEGEEQLLEEDDESELGTLSMEDVRLLIKSPFLQPMTNALSSLMSHSTFAHPPPAKDNHHSNGATWMVM